MNKLFTSIILLLLAACSRDLTSTRDFDRICQAFEALSQLDGLDVMSAGERDLFVFDQIKDIDDYSDAKVGWDVARSVVPVEERYDLFKGAVDSIVGGDWNCAVMKELAPSIEIVYNSQDTRGINFSEPVMLKDAQF